MKKMFFLGMVLCLALAGNVTAQEAPAMAEQIFYFYKGKEVELPVHESRFVVYLSDEVTTLPAEIADRSIVDSVYLSVGGREGSWWAYEVDMRSGGFWESLEYLRSFSEVRTVEYVIGKGDHTVKVSDLFYVRLREDGDLPLLEEIAGEASAVVETECAPVLGWYTLRNMNRLMTTVEMSNLFWETNLFEDVDPGFVFNFKGMTEECVSDANFTSEQWNMDMINMCQAWDITTGSNNVGIGVVDMGMMLPHQEFSSLYVIDSYDVSSGTPNTTWENHGTHVGGIIFAGHNDYEIAGVAPDAGAVLERVNMYTSNNNISSDCANAITRAVNQGAQVVNNSWGDQNSALYDMLHSSMLESALDYAVSNDVLLVFASGNHAYGTHQIDYPGRSRPEIMVVGSVTNEARRSNFSSYGPQLDLVAPGSNIYSSLNYASNSYGYMSGTSMATPHATGVAGLVRTVRPDLSAGQVHDILNASAQKIRPSEYPYGQDNIHYNGSWNGQVGYGLLDAHAALEYAQAYTYSDLMIRDSVGDDGSTPSHVSCLWNSPDIWIEDVNGHVVHNPHGNREYRVCVRVTNNSDVVSSGRERLFLNWAKAGVSLWWRHNWFDSSVFSCSDGPHPKGGVIGTAAGVMIPPIPPHSSRVVKVTWLTPMAEDYAHCTQFAHDMWHFCLLARVHDGETIVGEDATYMDMRSFVGGNNNVAWRNVSILNAQYPVSVVVVATPFDRVLPIRLRFQPQQTEQGNMIHKNADVYIRLDEELIQAWKEGGGICIGGEYDGVDRFVVRSEEFSLENLMLLPEKHYTVETKVQFYTQGIAKDTLYTFDLVEEYEDEMIGGERYVAVRDPNRVFEADAGENQTVFDGDMVCFTARDIGEEAQYIWRSESGDTLAVGQQLETTPEKSQWYVLEVISAIDGYKDFDTVEVTVMQAVIKALNPNPTNSAVTVSYRLSEGINNAILRVVDMNGVEVANVQADVGDHKKKITLHGAPAGHYYVQIVFKNRVLDSKVLIIQ